jgi:uracil-DNA glycosylase
MLYDEPGWSRSLRGFYRGSLHDYLKGVLAWVLESMPRVEWIACLGEEAWFLTCITIDNPSAARKFNEYRESFKPVAGTVGQKRIAAFPLHHPSRVSNDGGEKEWRAFAVSVKS